MRKSVRSVLRRRQYRRRSVRGSTEKELFPCFFGSTENGRDRGAVGTFRIYENAGYQERSLVPPVFKDHEMRRVTVSHTKKLQAGCAQG